MNDDMSLTEAELNPTLQVRSKEGEGGRRKREEWRGREERREREEEARGRERGRVESYPAGKGARREREGGRGG
jgi:hypothetical protein